MFHLAKRSIIVVLILFPFISNADVVILKNGKKIETEQAWEEGNQIKLYRFGSVIGYPKSIVERIEKGEIKVEEESSEEETPTAQTGSEKNFIDLEKQLSEKRSPKNAIEKAGNGTVTVKTLMGVGSGFFVTNDGYILTNKHVVEIDEQGMEAIGEYLEQERKKLEQWKSILEARGQFIKYEEKYNKRLQEYNEKSSEYWLLQKKSVSHGIKISFVDNSVLDVSLVRVSKDYDLALLKLDGYKTPYLEPSSFKRLAQGDQIYAIGSPLNLSHSVTSGVFSSYRDGYIQNNVPLNAGNSGGPLIMKEGKVIGINTWKLIGFDVEGLSFAIPIETAINEFQELKHLAKSN